ncbi:EamA family transporter [Roseibium sp. SCPC15]|jgi:O-acetylserine/cysteine efflux transporter|uniref:EamA family transporter n=1 Tax=Roseibium sp. SCP15 TaxID=3141376 RepID=UPI003337004B
MDRRDVLAAILAAFIWGATFPISALALETTPPVFFTFLRFSCAALFVFAIRRPPVPWPKLLFVGLLLGAGQYGLMFTSMAMGLPAGLASLLVHTQAFFTILIAMAVFSERLDGRAAIAVLLALAGLACLILDRSDAGGLGGIGLILLAALCGAGGNIILKSIGQVDMLAVVVWMSLMSPVPLAILSLLLESNGDPLSLFTTVDWMTAFAVAYSALLATIVVFTIWGRLLVKYDASNVAPFFLLVPVFGISLSAVILGERLTAFQITGAGLIFCGLALTLWPRSKRELEAG